MLEYARWKYILVAAVLAVALLFALPNVFGDDRALQIARKDRAPDRRRTQLATIETDAQGRRRRLHRASASTTATSRCASPTTRRSFRARDVVKDEKTGLDARVRQRDDVRVAGAALDPGARPARHAARPRPARRPLSTVPGGRRRRGRAACSTRYDQDFRRVLARREDRRSPTSTRSRSIRTFRTACACCCRRAPIAPRCAPRSRRRSPTSSAATADVAGAPPSIA